MPSPRRSLKVAWFGPTSAWAPVATRKTAPAAATAAHPIARRLNALILSPSLWRHAPDGGRGSRLPKANLTRVLTQVNVLLSTKGQKGPAWRLPDAYERMPAGGGGAMNGSGSTGTGGRTVSVTVK